MKNIYLIVLLVLAMSVSGCAQSKESRQTEITISAASSLKEALEEAGQQYMDEHPDVTLVFNFAGSGTLQQQISQGAPVDLFISAAEDKFNLLLSKNLIDEEYHTPLLGNELVLIAPKEQKDVTSLEDLASPHVRRFSIGTPETVPAGNYAKQALSASGLWDKLQGKLIPAKDVRQSLAYVETGNVDAGIVYRTDAMASDKINAVPIENNNLHDPIVYPAGVIASSKNHEEAVSFFGFLKSNEAMDIFKKYGFTAALD